MPYTPTTPTLTLCDDLAAFVRDLAEPQAPATVRRKYLRSFRLLDVEGRHAVVFPVGYANSPASRGEDTFVHRVRWMVWHKYPKPTGEEGPPDEWVDCEIDWVKTYIVDGLEFFRDGTRPALESGSRDVMQTASDVLVIYDPEELDQRKAFACVVDQEYEELI